MSTADWIGSIGVLAGGVALWWATSHAGWISPVFLPTPEATFASLREGLFGGDLWVFTLATVGRSKAGCSPRRSAWHSVR